MDWLPTYGGFVLGALLFVVLLMWMLGREQEDGE